ncbi:heterokaryon incompatibility protein-domain-containing protein [Fusarium oxysporum]|nr:heterokaryon incompatibility protein-domain-containing protein [Fusarium oxysporum]
MAEALSLGASVIAIIELSTKVTTLCLKYSIAVRSAEADIILLQTQLNDLRISLARTKHLSNDRNNQDFATSRKLVDTLDGCISQLVQLQSRLDPGETPDIMLRAGLNSLKWPFDSKEVSCIVSDLERYHQTIMLCLPIDPATPSRELHQTPAYDARLPMTANLAAPLTPNSVSVYQYSPLPEGYIRLLRLMPHRDEDAPIQGKFFDYPLLDSRKAIHRYEALSSVWVSSEKSQSLGIDNGYLRITTDLHMALKRLRDYSLDRIIWVDAICINQDDTEERNQQIQYMYKIYAKASRVVVWTKDEGPLENDILDSRYHFIQIDGTNGQVDEDQDSSSSELSDVISVGTISTSATSLPGCGVDIRAANEAFIDLLYSVVDLRKLMGPALQANGMGKEKLGNKMRRLLKVLSRDLSREFSKEDKEIAKFFMTSARRLSINIVNGLGDEKKDQPHKKKFNALLGVEANLEAEDEVECEVEAEVKAGSDSESDNPDLDTNLSGMRDLVASTYSFNAFITGLYDLAYPSFESKLKGLVEWQVNRMEDAESVRHIRDVASELLYSRPQTLEGSNETDESTIARIGNFISNCLAGELDWWPLGSPPSPCPPGNSRITWKCLCGDIRTAAVPDSFARRVVKLRKNTLPSTSVTTAMTPAPFAGPPPAPTYIYHSASQSNSPQNLPRPSLQNFSLDPQSSPAPTFLGITIPVPQTSRHIFFMVGSDRLHLRTIESQGLCNEQLFRKMRSEYRQVRGWFKCWFGLMTYSHCDFYRFEAYSTQRFCERGCGIPPLGDRRYYYKPRPMDNEPPISKHEFYDRFYRRVTTEACINTHKDSCGENDAVDRIPQKTDLEDIITNGRLQFWGIVAREKKSGLRMLVYILVSCIPGIVFFLLWLFALNKDSLQDASVLLMISFSLLGIFYAAQLF